MSKMSRNSSLLLTLLLMRMQFIVFNTLFSIKFCIADELNSANNQSVALSLNLAQEQDSSYGISEFQSVAGGKIALPCNTTLWGENEVSLVLWYRGDTGLPIYRVDARNNPLSKSKHSPADELIKRYFFDTSIIPPVLKIYPVMPNDAGEYRCRVDYRQSRTQNVIITLNVTVPPKEVLIMDMEGQRLDGVIGPYDEESQVLLICEAEGGKPSPSVIWFHGSKLIDDSFTTGPHGLVRNELNLRNLNRTDFMSILTCRASNTNLSEPVSSSVILDMNLKPLNVLIVTAMRPLVAGMRSELQCRSTGSRPAAQISWWKGSQRLSNVRDSVINDGNTTFSIVSFVPAVEDNGKHLSCRADNIPMPHTALEDGRILVVQFPPQITLSFGANIQKDSIREGSDVFLECHIKANPWIKEVSWLFNGKSLSTSQSSGIIVTNQSLVLQKVRRTHRGRYQCQAVNEEGDATSDPIDLKVNFAPVCKSGQKHQYGVARNELAKIRCELDAEPNNSLEFKWIVNTSSEMIDLRSFTVNLTTSIATYTPKTRYSYGLLLCLAQNSIGRQSQPCVYTIVPAGPPESVRNCAITNHSMTTLLIECMAGDDGGLHQTFILEVYSSGSEQFHSNHSSSHPSFIVNNLMPGTQFTLVIYAINGKGRSHTVSLSAVTLSPPEKHIAKGSIDQIVVNPLLGILIAIVASLVIIAIIVVVVIKIRSNQFDERDNHKIKGDSNSRGMLDNSHNSLTVDAINDCDQQIKEFVDVVNSINESGLTPDLSCNGMQLNSLKHISNANRKLNSNSNAMPSSNTYGKILSYNQYNNGTNIRSPAKDVTYAELTLSQIGANNSPISIDRSSSSMRRCSIGPIDPMTQYAQIDFQQKHNQQRLDCISSSSPNSSNSCLVGSMYNRESPIADGCSETEATVETPLMSNINDNQFRPQEIRINKESHRISRSGATPV